MPTGFSICGHGQASIELYTLPSLNSNVTQTYEIHCGVNFTEGVLDYLTWTDAASDIFNVLNCIEECAGQNSDPDQLGCLGVVWDDTTCILSSIQFEGLWISGSYGAAPLVAYDPGC